MSMIDVDDICEDLSDTLPDTTSAFTQLFLETGKMKVNVKSVVIIFSITFYPDSLGLE